MRIPTDTHFDGNPLGDDSPEVWERLVAALAPASMIVCIEDRMGAMLRGLTTSEDIWQETLLQVWRDRARCEWRGLAPFRRWVLVVAENRIRNAVDAHNALKRGGEQRALSLEDGSQAGSLPPSELPRLVASKTQMSARPIPATSYWPRG